MIDLGLPYPPAAETCATLEALASLRGPRDARTDKRHQGRLLIVGGPTTFPAPC